ncbi:hypothetical protein B0H66DRAFT_142662 [Apodospora peruviana]|uniref:Uncharacterized protein n=1 Tax=Apodospora peruviana TaxID=516989 RepID=A0AAE0MBS3_9PEZI|nr:hypothetical protein B0H66DRAFT_142662 [Apodospora peruviana]
MDPPSKKLGFLGNFSLFRGSSAPASEPQTKPDAPRKNGALQAVSLPRVEPRNASLESPAKRASDSQLASRKIIGRPQGPSSKLSQSMSVSDFTQSSSGALKTTNFSSLVSSTPRRMPGDNPYKHQSSQFASSTISHAPTNGYKATSFSGTATTPRNIFRSSMYSRPGIPTFSPRVPPHTANQSFPPNTPGRAPRGSTADINGRALSNTASAEFFSLRIPSPPHHLSGEALSKEVTNDPNRTGSIYADEFLAHYCPPDLDEHQKRQFFCILDLRRLKYAADEVFVKKDWKINILNFAKEYEKSRSLIMLRYGLYEFKTVRASESVKKEWKHKHGIADSDDEAEPLSSSKPTGASKRKAEDQLAAGDNALTASSSSGNKRSRVPETMASPATIKNKRKADMVGEPDENQPAKLFKPAATPQKAPSATKSVFESIANNTPSTTPAKPPVKNSLFEPTSSKPFGGPVGGSVFGTAPKAPGATTNIFGHLSDTSKGSGNDDADGESGDETSSNAEGDESEETQEASQSDELSVAASKGVSTPQFGLLKPVGSLNGASSASSEAGESTQGRSIFDRITRGADGQPVRQLPTENVPQLFATSDKNRSVSPVKEQAAAPANNTWNTGTPIKFSSTTNSVFGSVAPKPAPPAAIDFAASSKKAAEPSAPVAPAAPASEALKESAPPSVFGAPANKPEEATASSDAASKASSTQSPFGFPAKTTTPSGNAPSVFGGLTAGTSSQPFGSTTSGFSQPKANEEAKPAAVALASTTSLFGAKPAPSALETSKSPFESSTLFGSQKKSEPEKASQPQLGGLFGNSQPTKTKTVQPQTSSLFATNSSKPLFGGLSSTPAATTGGADEPAAKKTAFGGGDNKPAASPFSFGASTAAPTAQKDATSSEGKPLFGAMSTPAPAPETKSLFSGLGTPASSAPQEVKPLFGGASSQADAPKTRNLFGSTPSQGEAPKATSIFGNATNSLATASSGPVFSFGNAQMAATPAPQPAASQQSGSIFGAAGGSFTFSAGGSDASTVKNPFASDGGSVSAPSSFTFGAGGNDGSSQPSTSPSYLRFAPRQ